MDQATKELLNYGAVGLLAVFLSFGIAVVWKYAMTLGKTNAVMCDVVKENSKVLSDHIRSTDASTAVQALLSVNLQSSMKQQSEQNQAVLDVLVNLTRK